MLRFIITFGLLIFAFQAFAQRTVQPDTIRRKGGIVIMSNKKFVTIQANQSKITIDSEGGIVIESSEDIQIETHGDFTLEAENITLNASKDIAFTAGEELKSEATNTEIHSSAQTTITAEAGLDLESTATLNIGGALILIGGGGMPAARMGDTVVTDPANGAASVVTGSPTVLIGG